MADKGDKKGDKKDDKKSAAPRTIEEIIFILLGVFLGVMLIMRAIAFFTPVKSGTEVSMSAFEIFAGGQNGWFANFLHYVNATVSVYVTIASIFSMVAFLAILYVAWLTHKLSVQESEKEQLVAVPESLPSLQNQKWQRVQAHVNSQNPAEWRLAILEADVMLDDMLQSVGFHGETIGERLKNVSRGDFKTLDTAWEAHKIRNAIAHEGSDFLLSQRESRRVISLYETVFREFSYV